jgi:ubiquinone/menaquinone biosynthesis C-methylase UbiE
VQGARRRMSRFMTGAQRALDAGCGTGRLARTLLDAGVPEVWGLDPSPYMLNRSVRRAPEARFTQNLLEEQVFPSGYFDAVGACFLFHELPARVARRALGEISRILRPGGVLCITDPAPDHLTPPSLRQLWEDFGWQGLYFHCLGKLVYEPFLADWRSIAERLRAFEGDAAHLDHGRRRPGAQPG